MGFRCSNCIHDRILDLALVLVGSFLLALPRAPPRLRWRMWFGVGVHLLQWVLCVLALWSLRRARPTEPTRFDRS